MLNREDKYLARSRLSQPKMEENKFVWKEALLRCDEWSWDGGGVGDDWQGNIIFGKKSHALAVPFPGTWILPIEGSRASAEVSSHAADGLLQERGETTHHVTLASPMLETWLLGRSGLICMYKQLCKPFAKGI